MKIKNITQKVIGIISILAGIGLTIFVKQNLFIILALAGLVLLIPTKTDKKKFQTFLKSFKFNKTIFTIFVLDIAYLVIFFFLLQGALKLVSKVAEKIASTQLTEQTFEAIQQNLALAQQTIVYIILIFAVFLLLLLIIYSILKYFVWLKLLKQKFNKKKLLKFFALNLLWWLMWGILYYIFAPKEDAFAGQIAVSLIPTIFLVFYIYMTTFLHYNMLKTNKIKQSFAKGIQSLTLISKCLNPISYIIFIYFLIAVILSLLSLTLTPTTTFYIQALLLALLVVWLRNYLKTFIEKFKL